MPLGCGKIVYMFFYITFLKIRFFLSATDEGEVIYGCRSRT